MYEELAMYIGGEWCQGGDGAGEDVINPATEEVLARLPHASGADLDRSLAAASKGFAQWRATSAYDRGRIIYKAGELIRERADAIARTLTLEQGKGLAEARMEVLVSADIFQWYAEVQRSAAEGLKTVGVEAATVEDVIVTHLHYDHVGGFEQFPQARYHLQEKEMQFATGPHMCSATMNFPFDAEHVCAMVRNVFEGRVAFHDGARELAPGLSVHYVGGHTMGLQVVRVRTRRGFVVLASDASHFYENMEAGAPFPIVYNVGDMIRAFDTLRDLAESPAHIIPGHDPLVLERYPAPSQAAQGIAARLDADPK